MSLQRGGRGWADCGDADVVEWLVWHVALARDEWRPRRENGNVLIAVHFNRVGVKDGCARIVAYLANGKERAGG